MSTQDLQNALNNLPQNWQLTPVTDKKAPYQENWTIGRTREDIQIEIKIGRAIWGSSPVWVFIPCIFSEWSNDWLSLGGVFLLC